MKTLKFFDEEYKGDTIVRGNSEIIGYEGGVEIFRFSGIQDFSNYEIDGEWDTVLETDKEKVARLEKENEEMKEEINALGGAIFEIAMKMW